ncbi:MAG TPA: hypothetical protein VIA06_10835 [Candidatus Dormibacteraeota bacterium]|jgi:hypothetical protein|nr:hypothetical protein [Candidatus Dormibacteraeota bacterium]
MVRPLRWDTANEARIVTDHPERRLSKDEIEQAMGDPPAETVHRREHGTWEPRGQTITAGRWLIVAWVEDPEWRYVRHAGGGCANV